MPPSPLVVECATTASTACHPTVPTGSSTTRARVEHAARSHPTSRNATCIFCARPASASTSIGIFTCTLLAGASRAGVDRTRRRRSRHAGGGSERPFFSEDPLFMSVLADAGLVLVNLSLQIADHNVEVLGPAFCLCQRCAPCREIHCGEARHREDGE